MKKIQLYQSISFLFSRQIKDYKNYVVYSLEGKSKTIYGPALFSHIISEGTQIL